MSTRFDRRIVVCLLPLIFIIPVLSGCTNSSEKPPSTTGNDNWPNAPVLVTDATLNAFIHKYPTVIVDCWAPWCGPCLTMSPIIEELAKESQGKFVFGKLNTDENSQTLVNYSITSIPTLLVFKNGTYVDRIIGSMPKELLVEKLRVYE